MLLGIWLIVWAAHHMPPLTTPQHQMNAYAIWLIVIAVLTLISNGERTRR